MGVSSQVAANTCKSLGSEALEDVGGASKKGAINGSLDGYLKKVLKVLVRFHKK